MFERDVTNPDTPRAVAKSIMGDISAVQVCMAVIAYCAYSRYASHYFTFPTSSDGS